MHIGLYTDCDSRAGVLAYSLMLSAALRDAGVRVTVFTHEPGTQDARDVVHELEGASHRVVLQPRESSATRDAKLLASAVQSTGVDVFIPNYRQMPHAAAALLNRHGTTRSIGICHNDHRSAYDLCSRYEACLSRVVCASTKTAQQLTRSIPWRADDVVTIPHGVRMVDAEPTVFRGGVLRLVYHGRLIEEQKRVLLLLEVAKELRAREVPFHLTIIGDGPAKSQCDAAANSHLKGHLSVLGSLPWPALSRTIAESHVAVLVSEYEGFCFSLAEAMSAGLVPVAFRCGGVIEEYLIPESTGLLVESGSTQEFAAAIARLQGDPELVSRLGASARALIREGYAWSTVVRRYIALLENVTRDPVRRRWPIVRPIWVSPDGRTIGSIVERVGRDAGLWR